MAPSPNIPSVDDPSHAWYVAEGTRGEQLLHEGHVEQATAVFQGVLTRLGTRPSYGRAVILGRLGRCCQVAGRLDEAVRHLRDAIDVTGRLPPSDGVKGLRGTLRSDLGDVLRATGQYGPARKAYEAALTIAEELKDRRGQGVELGRLGALAAAEGDGKEALTRFDAARRLFHEIGEPDMEAASWHQCARLYHAQGQWDEAERHYREAARINEQRGRLPAAAQTWSQLYGMLAEIADRQARATSDGQQRAAMEARARDYREVQRHAPVIFATLARIGEAPSYGRAVMLGHLGRCLHMGRRPDRAVACVRDAIGITDALPPSDGVNGLRGALYSDLGDILHATGHDADAREAHEAALQIAEELQDVRGQAGASQRLGMAFHERPQRDQAAAFEVTAYDNVATDYVFDPDLLVEGPRQRRIVHWSDASLPDGVRPVVPPSARTWVDDEGAVWISLPLGDPSVERQQGCTVLLRVRRDVEVWGSPRVFWRVIRAMDGPSTVADIVSAFPAGERVVAARLLGALAATGAVDASGRPFGRFVHLATKKGVLPGGGLEGEAVLRLATDGNYRTYPEAPRIAVSPDVPDRLRAFHALTRSRRSSRDYRGAAVTRADFDALLQTACGVTGALAVAGRDVQLRAYPSSGALYAVEIYPVVFRVDGLEPAVYHYRAPENILEIVRPGIDPAVVVHAALPVEREMVAGAAALFCLTGWFPRHERKYGEGGYRMLVAEAGHISQNLILAATALGLSARPFGGVFDDLLNQDLGLEGPDEQFLLGVLVGRTGTTTGGSGTG